MAKYGTTFANAPVGGAATVSRIAWAAVALVALLTAACGSFKAFEKVNSDEILVVQDAVDGELHWYTTPGVKPQSSSTTAARASSTAACSTIYHLTRRI